MSCVVIMLCMFCNSWLQLYVDVLNDGQILNPKDQ